MPVYSINFYPIKLRNLQKKNNKCRTQSEECGVYSRIVRKTRYNLVIYTDKSITILSQQKKQEIGTCNIFLFYSYKNLQMIYRNCSHWLEKCKFETNAILE